MQVSSGAHKDHTSATRGSMLLSFTGLIPVALSIPLLLAHQYALGIVESLVLTTVVMSYHLYRKQGVTGLDGMSLLFGVATAVMHWGFHNDVILAHLDTVVYALLVVQVVIAQLRGEAWTIQFAKRSIDPSLWNTPAFIRSNTFVSYVWGAVLVLCLLCSVAPITSPVVHLWIPIVLLLGTGILTPRLARWYARRIGGT